MSDVHGDNHGQTPAAWTAVGVLLLGSVIGLVAVVARTPWLFFVGLGVCALGLVVGKVMQMMGMGAAGHAADDSAHDHAAAHGSPTSHARR